jgi:hypothetical protein
MTWHLFYGNFTSFPSHTIVYMRFNRQHSALFLNYTDVIIEIFCYTRTRPDLLLCESFYKRLTFLINLLHYFDLL